MDNFKHKKSLGQNFLKDENILKNIANAIDTNKNDVIIEVGPGQGALTKYLVNKDSHLICYEIDKRVQPYLEKYQSDKCKIYFKDFLNSDFEKDLNGINYDKLYFIANLPYYITTPILEKIVNSSLKVDAMVLMVQKEVADRLAAKPGSKAYGSLTVYLNYYYDIDKLFDVSRNCFDPIPNVDSAVVLFKKHNKNFGILDEEKLFKLIKDSFKMKRKNLKNNLKEYDLDKIEKILEQFNLSLTNRAEEIPLDVFIEISKNI